MAKKSNEYTPLYNPSSAVFATFPEDSKLWVRKKDGAFKFVAANTITVGMDLVSYRLETQSFILRRCTYSVLVDPNQKQAMTPYRVQQDTPITIGIGLNGVTCTLSSLDSVLCVSSDIKCGNVNFAYPRQVSDLQTGDLVFGMPKSVRADFVKSGDFTFGLDNRCASIVKSTIVDTFQLLLSSSPPAPRKRWALQVETQTDENANVLAIVDGLLMRGVPYEQRE